MTRKLDPRVKKAPGPTPWYRKNTDVEAFLKQHYDEFVRCYNAKTVTSFYTSVTTSYFLKFEHEQIKGDQMNPVTALGASSSASSSEMEVIETSTDSTGANNAHTQSDTNPTQSDINPTSSTNAQTQSDTNPTSSTAQIHFGVSTGTTDTQTHSNTESTGSTGILQPQSAANSIEPSDQHQTQSCTDGLDSASVLVSSGEGTSNPKYASASSEGSVVAASTDSNMTSSEGGVTASTDGDMGLDAVSFQQAARRLGWVTLSDKDLLEKQKRFADIRMKIGVYYRKEHHSLSKSNVLLDEVFTSTAKQRRVKPQRRSDVQVFQSKFYNTLVKDEADREWELALAEYNIWLESGNKSEGRKKPVRININTIVSKRVFEQQSEELKAEIRAEAEEEYEKSREEWEEAKKAPKGEMNAEELTKAIKKWGPAVSKVTGTLAENLTTAEFKMGASSAFFTMDPQNPVKAKVFWVHHGKTPSGLVWPKFDPVGFAAAEASLIRFAKAMNSKSTQNTAATSQAGASTLPSTMVSSASVSKKPGPGRDSTGMIRSEGLGRPKPKPKTLSSNSNSTSSSLETTTNTPATTTGFSTITTNPLATTTIESPVPALETDKDGQTSVPDDSMALGKATSTVPDDGGDVPEEEEHPWSHPKEHKFWSEMRHFIEVWGEEFTAKEKEDWYQDLEALVETFIEYEEAFKFTEDNGILVSDKEPGFMPFWDKNGRVEWVTMSGPTEKGELLLSNMRVWWEDILPVRETNDDDWAPLDCVLGKNGIWRFICAMVWILNFLLEEDISHRSDMRNRQIVSWMLLAREIEGTLGKVIQYGIWPPKKRKSGDQPERSVKRKRTRSSDVDKTAGKAVALKGRKRK